MTNLSEEELPPWIDENLPTEDLELEICAPDGQVTQGQFSALLQMVKDTQETLRRLQIQVAGLVNTTPGRANPPGERHAGGRLLSGKYAGKSHAWCVQNQPDYVIWIAGLGSEIAERWGFSPEMIAEAKRLDHGRTR